MLSHRTAGDTREWWPLLRAGAIQEWPLVEAAIAPSIPLLLGAVGVLGRSPAITLSLVIGVVDLAGWGYTAGRAMQQSRLRSLVSALAAAALGALMVLLKNLVH
jgi:hypothetical protein